MTWWQQLGWSAVFAIMLVVAIGGNTIVMWIVLGEFPFFLLSLPFSSVFSCSLLFLFIDFFTSFLPCFFNVQEVFIRCTA
jgi:hypothetical protein